MVKSFKEGINERGAFSAWLALATSYATALFQWFLFTSLLNVRIPAIGWLAGLPRDSQARGSWLGDCRSYYRLNGEGLQHWRCVIPIFRLGLIPNCISYDRLTLTKWLSLFQDGLRRMYQKKMSVFLLPNCKWMKTTLMKICLRFVEDGIIKGMYKLKSHEKKKPIRNKFNCLVLCHSFVKWKPPAEILL